MQVKFVKAIANKLEALDRVTRDKILREAILRMNERAESSHDMREIASFLVDQLGADAQWVVAIHDPANLQANWAPAPSPK